MLIFPPGHAQVAVEAWTGYITGEGDYTMGPCYVVDCDLGEKLGIRAMSN